MFFEIRKPTDADTLKCYEAALREIAHRPAPDGNMRQGEHGYTDGFEEFAEDLQGLASCALYGTRIIGHILDDVTAKTFTFSLEGNQRCEEVQNGSQCELFIGHADAHLCRDLPAAPPVPDKPKPPKPVPLNPLKFNLPKLYSGPFTSLKNGRVAEVDSAIEECIANGTIPSVIELSPNAYEEFRAAVLYDGYDGPQRIYWNADNMIVTRDVAITAYMSKHGTLAVQISPAMTLLSYCVR